MGRSRARSRFDLVAGRAVEPAGSDERIHFRRAGRPGGLTWVRAARRRTAAGPGLLAKAMPDLEPGPLYGKDAPSQLREGFRRGGRGRRSSYCEGAAPARGHPGGQERNTLRPSGCRYKSICTFAGRRTWKRGRGIEGMDRLGHADARNGVQNTHATHDVHVLFLAPLLSGGKKKEQGKNKNRSADTQIALRRSANRPQAFAKPGSVLSISASWKGRSAANRPAKRAGRPESDHRMLKPWTTHTYFRTMCCKFIARCGPKALTSHSTVRIYEPFTIPTLTIGFGTLEGETADPSLSIGLE